MAFIPSGENAMRAERERMYPGSARTGKKRFTAEDAKAALTADEHERARRTYPLIDTRLGVTDT